MNSFGLSNSSSFFMYLEFNNKYEHDFSEPIPYGRFE